MTNAINTLSVSAQRVSEILAGIPTQLLIDGGLQDASDGATFEVLNPATGEKLCDVASASGLDAIQAMVAAHNAQKEWAHTPARTRASLLHKLFDLIQENAEELAVIMTLEMGKPLEQSYGEVTYGGEFFRWFAEQAAHLDGHYSDTPESNLRMIVSHQPIGPTYAVTPWNFPLAMATRKLAPALAAGCTTIVKPSELTPLTTLKLGQLIQEAGFPAGVVNILPTVDAPAVSDAIMSDRRLRKISFTGSTEVGRHLLRSAADNILRTSMELGGNAPFIVLEDADLELAVEGAVAAKMRNMGEACTAANRFIVHASLADEFASRLATKFRDMKVGNGLDPETYCGPLISEKALERVAGLVEDAAQRGAQILCGGHKIEGAGNFYPPTVLHNVPAGSRVLTEEIFGPVAPIITFQTLEEAIELANDTEYGLASYLYTRDVQLGLEINEHLEAGLMGLNVGVISNAAAPFGGLKQSGMGREGGQEGIHDYMDTRYVGLPRSNRL